MLRQVISYIKNIFNILFKNINNEVNLYWSELSIFLTNINNEFNLYWCELNEFFSFWKLVTLKQLNDLYVKKVRLNEFYAKINLLLDIVQSEFILYKKEWADFKSSVVTNLPEINLYKHEFNDFCMLVVSQINIEICAIQTYKNEFYDFYMCLIWCIQTQINEFKVYFSEFKNFFNLIVGKINNLYRNIWNFSVYLHNYLIKFNKESQIEFQNDKKKIKKKLGDLHSRYFEVYNKLLKNLLKYTWIQNTYNNCKASFSEYKNEFLCTCEAVMMIIRSLKYLIVDIVLIVIICMIYVCVLIDYITVLLVVGSILSVYVILQSLLSTIYLYKINLRFKSYLKPFLNLYI